MSKCHIVGNHMSRLNYFEWSKNNNEMGRMDGWMDKAIVWHFSVLSVEIVHVHIHTRNLLLINSHLRNRHSIFQIAKYKFMARHTIH